MDIKKKQRKCLIYLNKLEITLGLITILSSEMIHSLRGKPIESLHFYRYEKFEDFSTIKFIKNKTQPKYMYCEY